jgi:hypothetical protein
MVARENGMLITIQNSVEPVLIHRVVTLAELSVMAGEAVQTACKIGICCVHTQLSELSYLGMHLIPLAPTGRDLSAWVTIRELRLSCGTCFQPSTCTNYLDEFTFRFNRRNSVSRGLLFYRLQEQGVVLPQFKGADWVGGRQITTDGG